MLARSREVLGCIYLKRRRHGSYHPDTKAALERAQLFELFQRFEHARLKPGKAQQEVAAVGVDPDMAARLRGVAAIQSTQFLLTPDPNVTYSACLMHKAEEMFETGVAPYPVERTLLVSGVLESCLTSKVREHARLETPHLAVAYQAPQKPQFAQT